MCVGEFLNWLDQQGKPLEEVTLEDISGYFQAPRTECTLYFISLTALFGIQLQTFEY